MSRPQLAPSPAAGRLSDRTLAATSVMLAVYLAGLLLSIAGNSVSGSSTLVRTVKQRLFTPWMGPAWLDLGFDHPLTYGLPEDGDHALELHGATAAAAPIRLPGNRTGEQAARWRRLARRISLATDDETAVTLAAGVGQGGFEALGGDDVIVRTLRWPLPDRGAPADSAPRPVKPYEARVRRVAGETQLVELGGDAKRVELAPVLRGETAPTPAAARERSP
jgi:hypothetical protein